MPFYQCPVCGAPLSQQAKLWRCSANHCFDQAKEGYVNLLLANQKHSREPGDNADMLRARREFLSTGLYRFLPEAVIALVQEHLDQREANHEALDLGCGEGYYTHFFASTLGEWQWHGVDISKAGIRMAAKRYPEISFAVASNFQLPVLTGTQSLVTQIFAPTDVDEISRVLRKQGLYLVVNPAPRHLWELKEHLYDAPEEHSIRHIDHEDFTLQEDSVCTQVTTIEDNQVLNQLFQMTPFFWNVGKQRQEALQQMTSLELTFSFHLALYQRG